jgi:eukaryotic-like serine/threonine-protein kinase
MTDRTLSHYRILRKIGGGGMGEVYEAEDTRLGRHVALKLLPAHLTGDPQAIERLRREARAASSLNHPHICTIYDIGEQDRQHFIAMELLDGQTLRQRIGGRPIDADHVLDIGIQVADALDAAHAAGIVHRDIKPANIFVTKRGDAKVLDFGLAMKATQAAAGSDGEAGGSGESQTRLPEEHLTSPGLVVGTTAYMSPEQAYGDELDRRSDLFSFGAVLYEMATGHPPFTGKTTAAVFDGILHVSPPPVTEVNRRALPELDRVISRALEKDRDLRYQSAGDLRAELQRIKRDSSSAHAQAASGHRVASPGERTPSGGTPAARSSTAAASGDTMANRVRRFATSRLGIAVLVLVVVAAAAAVGVLLRVSRSPALTDRDTVVLADFQNTTDDPSFDIGLKQALSVQLSQSPFLNIFPESRIRDRSRGTLVLMQRQPTDALTPAVAQEVCQREGLKAMLAGSIASFGATYSLTLTATNCVSGEVLATEQATAGSREKILDALAKISSGLRTTLGESLASVQKYDVPARATTSNLEALTLLGQALALRDIGKEDEAIPLLERAVEMDPTFAKAWGHLGALLGNAARDTAGWERAKAARTRAFELRDRVTEPERYYIESGYYLDVLEDFAKATRTCESWKATYPRDSTPYTLLGNMAAAVGDSERAVVEAREALRLEPMSIEFSNLSFYAIWANRFDEAQRAVRDSFVRKIDAAWQHSALYALGYLRNEKAAMQREVEWSRGTPAEGQFLRYEAFVAAVQGRLRDAARFNERADAIAERNRTPVEVAVARAGFSLRAASVGNLANALSLADAAAAVPDASGSCLMTYAIAGDQRRFERLLPRFVSNPPAADFFGFDMAPFTSLAKGVLQLKRGMAEDAVQTLRAAAVYEKAARYQMLPPYWLGYALIAAGRPTDAINEFQMILSHRSIAGMQWPLAHVGLARAHAAAGNVAASRKAYEDFFALWKDADPDVPILLEARKEYAALK